MIQILYFLRHGLAADRDEWEKDDNLRPLTAKGMKNMVRTADTLANLNLELDAVLSSPLTRAYQTADIVAKRLDMEEEFIQDERLSPGFGLQDLANILADHPEAENIMLVGHEPDFSTTLGELIGGGSLICKKGSLARVDITNNDPLQGDLVWLLPPRLLVR